MAKSFSSTEELIQNLESTRDQVLLYFDLPSELDLERRYSPGKWTIKQILLHLADAENVLLERICRGISNPGQEISGFDQDKWASTLKYKTASIPVAKALFTATRNRIIELVDPFYLTHGSNSYTRDSTDLWTVKEEFDKVVWHCQQHLEQMGVALGTC